MNERIICSQTPAPITIPTGGPGAWVFTYEITYTPLEGGTALAGHIHDTLEPPGAIPTEQFGPVIHPLDELDSPINGDWRFDDATNPLTDEFAALLQAGQRTAR